MYIALNASSKLTGVVGVGVTTVPVTAGTGTQFAVGSNHSYVTFQDATNKETCKITGQSGDNLTVVRTKALSWAIGTVIECRPCAEAMADYAVAPQIDGSGAAALADTDNLGFSQTSVAGALKKITWANFRAALKTYLDTLYLTLGGGTLTGALLFKSGLNNVASAATVNLTAIGSNTAHITGTTGISAFTMTSGQVVDLIFDGVLTLTHHATNNNLPGGANITTAAGDRARYWYDGTTVWCVAYNRAAGTPVVSGPGTDTTARDQIALTNIRLMLQTAITTGALVQGKQWELATDEWGSSSTNQTYTAPGTFGYYSNPGAPVMVSAGTGTIIGNASSNPNNGFDGVTVQAYAGTAPSIGPTGYGALYVGKDWGAGNTKTISRFKVYAANDYNGFNTAGGSTMTIKLQGSTDNFSSSVVDLYTVSGVPATASSSCDVTSGINVSTAYRYHRIMLYEDSPYGGSHGVMLAEVEFYTPGTPANMTLIPDASVSVAAAPTYMDCYFLWKDDSGSGVLGTDLTVELSRNNGGNYTTATITNLASYDGTYSIIKGRADVSGQPSGTSMICRIKTLNNKAQRVAAPALYAE